VKRYLSIVIAAAATVLLVGIVYITAPAAESPRTRLERDVDRELAKARRLLAGYDPLTGMLRAAEERLTGKGGRLEATPERMARWSQQWEKIVSFAQQDQPVPPVAPEVQSRLTEANNLYQQYTNRTAQLPTGPAGDPIAARKDLEDWLARNDRHLADAIRIVEAALNMSAQDGDQAITGRDVPEAGRLRAVLAYHQAEALRRKALLRRTDVEELSHRLATLRARWIALMGELTSAQQRLGMARSLPATTGASSQPVPSADRSPLLERLFGSLRGTTQSAAQPPAPSPDQAPTTEPATPQETQIAFAVRPVGPSLPERIAQLERERAATIEKIGQSRSRIETLTQQIATISEQIKTLRTKATDAERKMAEMETGGFDPVRAPATSQRLAEYEALSRVSRESSRQADLLEHGGYANARLVSDDEQWHQARVLPADANAPLAAQSSLRVLRHELTAAKTELEGAEALLKLQEDAIKVLKVLHEEITSRLGGLKGQGGRGVPGLTARHAELKREIEQTLEQIETAAREADEHERAAIQEIDIGLEHVQQARSAMSRRQDEARSAQPAGGEPDPRLQKIEQEAWRTAELDALAGDLHMLKAWIHHERSSDARSLGTARQTAADMGFKADPQAAQAAADAEVAPARAAAQSAVQAYQDAMRPKDDWTYHMNLAAAYYLLSQLTSGPDATRFRNDALREYREGTAGQEDNPDRRVYVRRVESLQRAQAAAK